MRRLFWLGLGVAVGVVAVRKLSRVAEAYTPQGVAASVQSSAGAAVDRARSFVADVRAAMAEREEAIHAALGRPDDPDGTR